MSEFEAGDRVRILKEDQPRLKYSRVEFGYVIGHDEAVQPIVEFNYRFAKYTETFSDDELELA